MEKKSYRELFKELVGDERLYVGDLDEKRLLIMLRKIVIDLQKIEKEINALYSNEAVQKFVILKDKKAVYQNLSNNLVNHYEKKLKENCNHDLWYLVYSEKNDYEQRLLWRCRCLDCGYDREDSPRFFGKNVIVGDGIFGMVERNEHTFNEVQYHYRLLLNKYDQYFERRKGLYDQKKADNLILETDELAYNKNPVIKVLKKKFNPKR